MYLWLRLAGSGKTFLIQFIIAALNLNPEEDVAYIAYTGKASEVLREKGCPNAQTAHKLLYYSKQLPSGRFLYRPRAELEHKYKLIVVDEVSMVPIDMWELLLSHRVYILACGDPFQLSPIDKTKANSILDHPHIFLDEVMRQAKESDIITTSMDIREGREIKPKKGNDIQIFRKQDFITGMYEWADEILVATNKNRFKINKFIRNAQGRGVEPENGDKVICLKNSWDIISNNGNPLINGTIGFLENKALTEKYYTGINGKSCIAPILFADIVTSSGDRYQGVPIDYTALTTGQKVFTPEQEYSFYKKKKMNPDLPIEFNYGHAITTHRAQGSSWGKVLVIEENFPFDKEEHRRWLYTSITRSENRLTLILR